MRKNISITPKLLAEAQQLADSEGLTFSGLLAYALREFIQPRASAQKGRPALTADEKRAKELATELKALIEKRQADNQRNIGYEDSYAEVDSFCLAAAKSLNLEALQGIFSEFLYLPTNYRQWKERL